MKAAQVVSYSKDFDVTVTDTPEPTPEDNQVAVAVRAAAVNPFDIKIVQGLVQQMIKLSLPATIGGDFAGVITVVGKDVTDFKAGDEVYGQAKFSLGKGAFAAFAVADAQAIAPKPKSISFSEAAALPLTAVSAYQALVEHIKLSAGHKILIHGAAGGIGTIAVQLAKHLGAYVAATAAANEVAYVKSLGADEVIDYKSQKFEELLNDYDAVFDTVGGEVAARSFKVLKRGGILVSMRGQPDEELARQFQVTAIGQGTQVTTERLAKIIELVEGGVLVVKIDKTFTLEQIVQALQHLKDNHPKGKVVIEVSA